MALFFSGCASTATTPPVTTSSSLTFIFLGGSFTALNGSTLNYLAKLTNNGSIDSDFVPGTGPDGTVSVLGSQSDGKILLGGWFIDYDGTTRNYVARINNNGSLDSTFDSSVGANSRLVTLSVQSDGKILLGGVFTQYNNTVRGKIARLNTDGSLDVTFDSSNGANNTILTLTTQSDGKILIGGVFTTYGGTARTRIARINTDGSLDATFDPGAGANSGVNALKVQNDGKILIAGDFTTYGGTARTRIARINADGSLDASFNPGTGANNTINALEIQSDGKLLLGGNFTTYNGTARNYIARVNSDGSLDTTFDAGTDPNAQIACIKIQNDGKILIGGYFTNYAGTSINRITRLSSTGAIDTSFNPGTGVTGTGTFVNSIALTEQNT